jgi:branched-chain amino acid transport system substrate-binding protein
VPAAGADTRVAFVGALSGPHAAAGRDQRDGFLLAGLPVELIELDDAGDPGRAKAIAARLLAENIAFVTGFTTSESALALLRELEGRPLLLLSSGAGPVALAGEQCARNFFSTAPPEDAVHENAGAIASALRYRKVHIVSTPGQRAAAEAAFRRRYSGETAAGNAVADIRESRPHGVYVTLPPEAMVTFLRAYERAGLFHRFPVIAANVEPDLLAQLGPDFAGLIVSVPWAAGSGKFEEAFKRRYGRTPSSHAMQGYEAARRLGEALRKARSPSVDEVARLLAAGLGPNRFASSDWHAWEVFNKSSGEPYLVARQRTLRHYAGPHAERCKTR